MPSRDGAGPGEQNLAGVVESIGRQAQAAQGDEGVAAPIGEPGIAGDDGLARAAADQVGIGGAVQRRGKFLAAAAFDFALERVEGCLRRCGRRQSNCAMA